MFIKYTDMSTDDNIINIMTSNVFHNWDNFIYFKIYTIDELNDFLYINKKQYTIGGYSYIINILFNLNINENIISDLLLSTMDIMECNLSIKILFKYGLLKREKTLSYRIQKLIETLKLVKNVDYKVYITKDNTYEHHISIMTFIKCLKLSKGDKISSDLQCLVDHYHKYTNTVKLYNKQKDKYLTSIITYFLNKLDYS